MAEAERLLLAGEARFAGFRLIGFERGLLLGLAAPLERGVELELIIEMIFDHALVAAGDEDEMLDARFARLVDHMLDQRPVDHGEHFLRHRLGGGEEAGAETGDGEDRLADAFHGAGEPVSNRVGQYEAGGNQANGPRARPIGGS